MLHVSTYECRNTKNSVLYLRRWTRIWYRGSILRLGRRVRSWLGGNLVRDRVKRGGWLMR